MKPMLKRALHVVPAVSLALAVAAPLRAAEGPANPQLQAQLLKLGDGEFASYYAYGAGPLWIAPDGSLNPAANELLQLMQTADDDGLDPSSFNVEQIQADVQRMVADSSPAALAQAELSLSRAFVAYSTALRRPGEPQMAYEHNYLRPGARGAYSVLAEAAKAPSLSEYIQGMKWMHPLYAPLRRAAIAARGTSPRERAVAVANLARIRAIPPQPGGRHIVVDSGEARLWMYDGDVAVDSMRVIVGKHDLQTPIMAGYVRFAILNPYWNVPDNLIRKTIAPNVLAQGVRYLKTRGYEVLSGWEEDAVPVDPSTIDWKAAKAGKLNLHVRQRPGTTNSMGRVKYEFPNADGIYLHDTPDKSLMLKADRHLSNGCVRLEDAQRLGKWLMGAPLETPSGKPEQKVDLPKPVPIYITYLTARAEGDGLAAGPDPYGLDGVQLAALATNGG